MVPLHKNQVSLFPFAKCFPYAWLIFLILPDGSRNAFVRFPLSEAAISSLRRRFAVVAIFLWFLQFVENCHTGITVLIFAFCFLIFARSCLCCDSRYLITLFSTPLILNLYRSYFISRVLLVFQEIYRNASSASRITSGCTLFVQESLRLLACNALLGTLPFADFFALHFTYKGIKNKYASKIMLIFLIFNSF